MAGNRVRFVADMDDKVSGKLAKIRDNFDRLGKAGGFKAFTQGIGLGVGQAAFNLLGQAAGAAADFIGESIHKASALNESLNKSKVVFGDAAGSIEKFGKGAAQSMGLSEQAAVEAASTFGNFFVGLGKGSAEAADMSKRLVGLAGDLASFNNIDPTVALEKLRSGLAGEAEPLRSVGVFLSETKVKAKGMELGLADAHGEMTEGAKVLARYQLILDETTTAQGDFARTADGLANSQRIATAELENYQAELGDKFLPIAKEVTKAQIEFVDILRGVADTVHGETTPEVANLAELLSHGFLKGAGDAAEKTEELNQAAEDTRGAFGAWAGVMGRSKAELDRINSSMDEQIDKLKDLRQKLKDAADTAIANYYDPIQTREEILTTRSELAAARRERAHTKAGSTARREANRTITALMRESDELNLSLLKTGKMTTGEWSDWMKTLKGRIEKAEGPAKAALRRIYLAAIKLHDLQISIRFSAQVHSEGVGASVHAEGRAIGGPVMPWQAYTVGEHGPETLVMGSQGGTIIPNGGGQPVILQVNLDGRTIAEVVDEHLYRKMQRASPTAGRA